MSTETNTLHYRPILGRLYITAGILFTLIFIIGLAVLGEWLNLVYAICSLAIIYIGIQINRHPYAEYSAKAITLNNFWGSSREQHEFESINAIEVTDQHVFLNGIKLKMNAWFLQKGDWDRMKRFYSDSSELEELQEV